MTRPTKVLSDAFTGTGALAREGRVGLAKVLGCLPDGIAGASLGDLTDRRYRRRLAAAVASATEPPAVLNTLAQTPLLRLAPAAERLPDSDIDASSCPRRLYDPLRNHDALRWSRVLALRLGDVLESSGLGPRDAAQLLGMAVERSLAGLTTSADDGAGGAHGADVAILVSYDDRSGGSLRAALTQLTGTAHPEPVRRAAGRLLRSCELPAGRPAGGTSLGNSLDELVETAGSARDQAVFVARELNVVDRPTLDQLSRRFGLSPERIRQLRVRAADRVLAAVADAPPSVRRAATELGDRLGVAAPAGEVRAAVAEVAGELLTTRAERLLSWLAGPYRTVRTSDDWLAIEPDRLVTRTRRALSEDGGVRLAEELDDELARAGVAAYRDGWLHACGARLVDGMVVSTAGTSADVLERLLFAIGRPATSAELSSVLSNGHMAEGLGDVLRRDRRFLPADARAGAFELAEWRAATDKRTNGAPARSMPAAPERDATGLSPVAGRAWLRVPVDDSLLSGRHHAAPPELVQALGLAPGQRRTFAGRFGPVSLVNEGGDPTIETLRPVALASGAGRGDVLALGFTPDGALTVELINGAERSPQHLPVAQGVR